MSLKTMKPGDGRRVVGGFILSFLLHPLALVAVGIIGSWFDPREGYLLVLPFITFMGVAQWIYLGPASWLLRRRGSTAMATGVVIAGGLVTVANVLFYVGFGLRTVMYNAEVRRIQQQEREHPLDSFSVNGVVTLVDDKHFEFRREDDGTVLSLVTWEGLEYIFLRKDGGYEMRTRDILKPGVRVAIDYSHERGQPPLAASIVRVYEEGASRN